MKYFVPIDKSTIRKNPNGGQSVFYRYWGETTETYTEGNTIHINKKMNVEPIYLLSPLPMYLYEYIPTLVKCENCNVEIYHNALKEIYLDDCYSDKACPKCGYWNDFMLEYEKFSMATLPNVQL